MKTIPFAVDGRWRATVMPANATCRPWRSARSSVLESVLRAGGARGGATAGASRIDRLVLADHVRGASASQRVRSRRAGVSAVGSSSSGSCFISPSVPGADCAAESSGAEAPRAGRAVEHPEAVAGAALDERPRGRPGESRERRARSAIARCGPVPHRALGDQRRRPRPSRAPRCRSGRCAHASAFDDAARAAQVDDHGQYLHSRALCASRTSVAGG